MTAPKRWAVITPDGRLTWYPASATREVEATVGGQHGATDQAWVEPPLRLLAADVALLFPEDYPPNAIAARVLAVLSDGRLTQPWRGAIALVEYEQDSGPGSIGEWLWPKDMSPEWVQAIEHAAAGAAEELNHLRPDDQ